MPRASHAARTALALAPIARWREVISLNHVELNVGALGAGLVEPFGGHREIPRKLHGAGKSPFTAPSRVIV